MCGAEHRAAAVQELRLPAGSGQRNPGLAGHDHHQLHAVQPQPPRPVLRGRLHHLRAERRRQAQDQPGGRSGPAAGRAPGHHPRQLVSPHHGEELQRHSGTGFAEERDGSVHLHRLGLRRAAASVRRSDLLLQQTQIRKLGRNRQVLQQQRLGAKHQLRVEALTTGLVVIRDDSHQMLVKQKIPVNI